LKKEWHPAIFKNQEEVWKREQAVLAEQKKLETLQKEKAEERIREELERSQPGGRTYDLITQKNEDEAGMDVCPRPRFKCDFVY
jgi:N-terminal domain of CBF1 interacting co-repressor CIR